MTATQIDLTQCQYTTSKGRRCKLHPDHVMSADPEVQKHRMIIRTTIAAPRTLTELRAANAETFGGFVLESEEVPDAADLAREHNRKVERDADQLRADADALAAYEAWEAAGKPAEFSDLGSWKPVAEGGKGKTVRRYIFPPEAFDSIIVYLRRTTQKGGPVHGKRLEYRRKTHESGNAMIYFRIVDATPPATATVPSVDATPPATASVPSVDATTSAIADLSDQENPEEKLPDGQGIQKRTGRPVRR